MHTNELIDISQFIFPLRLKKVSLIGYERLYHRNYVLPKSLCTKLKVYGDPNFFMTIYLFLFRNDLGSF